jgi:hypothetical protein
MYSDDELTNEDILASADPALCQFPLLQIAYDRAMISNAHPATEHYAKTWRNYLQAGGDRSMRDKGIDLENWRRLVATHQLATKYQPNAR